MLTNLTCMHTVEKTNVGFPNTCTLCTVSTVLSNVMYTVKHNYQLPDPLALSGMT